MAKWKLCRLQFGNEEFGLTEGQFTIGRGINNSILLSSAVISRDHCSIHVKADDVFITDSKSLKGVYVGGEKIPPNIPYKLTNNDIIGFGWTNEAPVDNINDNEKHVYKLIKYSNSPKTGVKRKLSEKTLRQEKVFVDIFTENKNAEENENSKAKRVKEEEPILIEDSEDENEDLEYKAFQYNQHSKSNTRSSNKSSTSSKKRTLTNSQKEERGNQLKEISRKEKEKKTTSELNTTAAIQEFNENNENGGISDISESLNANKQQVPEKVEEKNPFRDSPSEDCKSNTRSSKESSTSSKKRTLTNSQKEVRGNQLKEISRKEKEKKITSELNTTAAIQEINENNENGGKSEISESLNVKKQQVPEKVENKNSFRDSPSEDCKSNTRSSKESSTSSKKRTLTNSQKEVRGNQLKEISRKEKEKKITSELNTTAAIQEINENNENGGKSEISESLNVKKQQVPEKVENKNSFRDSPSEDCKSNTRSSKKSSTSSKKRTLTNSQKEVRGNQLKEIPRKEKAKKITSELNTTAAIQEFNENNENGVISEISESLNANKQQVPEKVEKKNPLRGSPSEDCKSNTRSSNKSSTSSKKRTLTNSQKEVRGNQLKEIPRKEKEKKITSELNTTAAIQEFNENNENGGISEISESLNVNKQQVTEKVEKKNPLKGSPSEDYIQMYVKNSDEIKRLSLRDIIFGHNIVNINNIVLLFEAMEHLPTSSLRKIILNPEPSQYPKYKHNDTNTTTSKWTATLDSSQLRAVRESVDAALDKSPALRMVQGPPGTGKSSVICAMVMSYFYDGPTVNQRQNNRGKILICATSNAAVDELVIKLLKMLEKLPPEKRLSMVRVGRLESMHGLARSMSSKTLAWRELKRVREREDPTARHEIDLYTAQMNKMTEKSEDPARAAYCENHAAYYARQIELRRGGKDSSSQLLTEERRLMQEADVIATTLSSAVNHMMRCVTGIELCIVDEAGQAIEAETLLPLILGVTKLTLVGDPQQLPSFICSQRAKKYGLDQSLLSRLTLCSENWDRQPAVLLNRQYRMHPSIADYPNRAFYAGRVQSVPPPPVQLGLPSYCILGISGSRRDPWCEARGASAAAAALALAARAHDPPLDVAVITPYVNQRDHIRTYLGDLMRKSGSGPVEVNTVDSFQGQERDVVVVSVGRRHGVGFLKEAGRMNVLLTRARHVLLVCLDPDAVWENKQWRTLVEDAKNKKLFKELPHRMCQPSSPRQISLEEVLNFLKN